MNIGVDIDNVISNFNEVLLEEYILHDKELGNSGVPNENAEYIRRGMFDWDKEHEEKFYKANIERIITKLKVKDCAKEYIDKLRKNGHEIYIITGRDNGDYVDPYKITKEWLKKFDIKYDKLILTDAYKNDKHGKTEKCIENDVAIMIDDSANIVDDCIKAGVTAIIMDTPYNRDYNAERVHDWKEAYEYINNYKIPKLNVILDTDIYNECDDQFALSYLIKSQDRFNIEKITVAPYSHRGEYTEDLNQTRSFEEVIKICTLCSFDYHNKVFKGSEGYISDGYNKENDACREIIKTCLKNEKTYIIAIGAITNVALAIKKEPRIIDKIEVVWLGGHSFLMENNIEFNFRQDVEAVRTVFESKVKLTVIPAKNVASNLITSIYELEHNLKGKSELCDYLIGKFYNDGYHELKIRRPIWDISAIAYLINKGWFDVKMVSCPEINEDKSYRLTNGRHLITMVNYLNANKIYEDLFKKLG